MVKERPCWPCVMVWRVSSHTLPTSGHEPFNSRVRVPDSGTGLTGMLVGWLRPGVGYLVLFTRLEMCKKDSLL